MITRRATLIMCLLLAGCIPKPPNFVNASDPAITTKLGISAQDWTNIQQLLSQEKGFIIKDAANVGSDLIDVELKKPDDTKNDQGGPVERVEKQQGRWIKQPNFDGWWAVGK